MSEKANHSHPEHGEVAFGFVPTDWVDLIDIAGSLNIEEPPAFAVDNRESVAVQLVGASEKASAYHPQKPQ